MKTPRAKAGARTKRRKACTKCRRLRAELKAMTKSRDMWMDESEAWRKQTPSYDD